MFIPVFDTFSMFWYENDGKRGLLEMPQPKLWF